MNPYTGSLAKPYLIKFSESVNVLPLSASPADLQEAGNLLAEPVLYWVVRGRSVVEVDGHEHPVNAGTALWVAGGRRVRVRLGRADVLVPLPGIGRGEPVRTVTFVLPASWHPWLLHAFGEVLGYLDGGSSRALLEQLLAATSTPERGPAAPPSPLSADLVALAAAIITDSTASVTELARTHLVGWTPRTLQRRFTAETGLTPEKWARQQRMAQAADLLAEGNDILAVAHAVGYETASGFSRSFREQTGMSPGRWRTRTTSTLAIDYPSDAPSPLELPAQRTWPRINGSHVAVWALQGRAVLTVAGHNLLLEAGSTVVIPRGCPIASRSRKGPLCCPSDSVPVATEELEHRSRLAPRFEGNNTTSCKRSWPRIRPSDRKASDALPASTPHIPAESITRQPPGTMQLPRSPAGWRLARSPPLHWADAPIGWACRRAISAA